MDDEASILVFLDTSVFHAHKFDWSSRNFTILKERVEQETVSLILTDIVLFEIERGMRAHLSELNQSVKRVAKTLGVTRALNDPRTLAIEDLRKNPFTDSQLQAGFETFLEHLAPKVLSLDGESGLEAFNLYLRGKPPFAEEGNKKHEFPDAANVALLEREASKHFDPIYVVSSDGDLKAACDASKNLIHVQHISEVLQLALRMEQTSANRWSDETVLELFRANLDDLKRNVASALRFSSTVNNGDGIVDDIHIDDVYVDWLTVTAIDRFGSSVHVEGELFHTVVYFAAISIEDKELHNLIEEDVEGTEELVANFVLSVEFDDSDASKIVFSEVFSLDYIDGLNLRIRLSY